MTNPLGYPSGTAYDPVGNVTTTTDGAGIATYAYDPLNRQTVMIDPLSQRTTTAYDAAGSATTVTGPGPVVTTQVYDLLNRVTQTELPSGAWRRSPMTGPAT